MLRIASTIYISVSVLHIRQPKRPKILMKKSVWDQSVEFGDKSLLIWDQTRSNHHLTFWKSLSLIGCGTNLHNFMLRQFLGSLNALLQGLQTHEKAKFLILCVPNSNANPK